MVSSYLVVDGSNIATEGRSTPSLQQLDEAIRQYQGENPGVEIIVVVDATFGHRIDSSERAAFDEAVAHGEVVSPPAGAIGRGDAFLLRVAERVGARVLSNDSFQEFHAQHPWLFDEGRLIGGKPIPGVGWIFTPRLPVRGPRSRAAVKTAKVAKATKAAKVTKATGAEKAAKAMGAAKVAKATKTAKVAKATGAEKAAKATKTAKVAKATGAEKVAKATGAKKAAKATKAAKVAKATGAEKTAKATAAEKAAKATKAAKVTKATGAEKAAKATKPVAATAPATTARRTSKAAVASLRAAIDIATDEALHVPEAPTAVPSSRRGRRQSAEPPAAVNNPLTFVTFVAEHPLGSIVEGTVSAFVSHGAVVDVEGMSCYLPLTGLGVPAPRRAREVVQRGEKRSFVLMALDPPRRGAELALPEVARLAGPVMDIPVSAKRGAAASRVAR